ncbi:MAG TPA: hypothetical protein PLH34_00930 [Bacillota bacterium]|nr:hypothetical protein [Bacillota bacterium]
MESVSPLKDLRTYTKIDEIPFDFTRMRVSVVACTRDGCLLVTKGAPESMLGISGFMYLTGKSSIRGVIGQIMRIIPRRSRD